MTAHGDLSSTLSDLERKLKDLERELADAGSMKPSPTDVRPGAAGPPPATPGDPAQHDVVVPSPASVAAAPLPPTVRREPAHALRDPAASQMVADAEQSFGVLHHQLDELVRFREQLESSTRQLTEDYDRLLQSLRHPEP